jgi:hypothetical protein
MWKIDPNNKFMHKYKHDHINIHIDTHTHTHIYDMFSTVGLFEDKGRKERR